MYYRVSVCTCIGLSLLTAACNLTRASVVNILVGWLDFKAKITTSSIEAARKAEFR